MSEMVRWGGAAADFGWSGGGRIGAIISQVPERGKWDSSGGAVQRGTGTGGSDDDDEELKSPARCKGGITWWE